MLRDSYSGECPRVLHGQTVARYRPRGKRDSSSCSSSSFGPSVLWYRMSQLPPCGEGHDWFGYEDEESIRLLPGGLLFLFLTKSPSTCTPPSTPPSGARALLPATRHPRGAARTARRLDGPARSPGGRVDGGQRHRRAGLRQVDQRLERLIYPTQPVSTRVTLTVHYGVVARVAGRWVDLALRGACHASAGTS